MDHFDVAAFAARTTAHGLIAEQIEPDTIADAMVTEAMAVWAAATGRHTAAREFLAAWTEVRDGH